ncbi:MAG: NUDIX hydrolase [Cyanobacteria bacterium P01_B01_bin.77]
MRKLIRLAFVSLLVCLLSIIFVPSANATQVYAVVHDGSGDFLIAKKNEQSYFYGPSDRNPRGTTDPRGMRVNGCGNYAFPGGRLDRNENIVDGATREFYEETSVQLEAQDYLLVPAMYCEGDDYGGFCGVYFQYTENDFNRFVELVQAGLLEGEKAARFVRSQNLVNRYGYLRQEFGLAPMDNELSYGTVWNLETNWDDIIQLGNNPVTDWFYLILKNLNNVYFPGNRPIP